jgi:hypothetical protein
VEQRNLERYESDLAIPSPTVVHVVVIVVRPLTMMRVMIVVAPPAGSLSFLLFLLLLLLLLFARGVSSVGLILYHQVSYELGVLTHAP